MSSVCQQIGAGAAAVLLIERTGTDHAALPAGKCFDEDLAFAAIDCQAGSLNAFVGNGGGHQGLGNTGQWLKG
jgi:hypothetical protein